MAATAAQGPANGAPCAAFAYSLKEVCAVTAVVPARLQAAPLEISARNRTGRDHSAQASPQVPCRHGRPGGRVSLVFLRDSPSGVYCSARKEEWLVICSSCMAGLRIEMPDFSTAIRIRLSLSSPRLFCLLRMGGSSWVIGDFRPGGSPLFQQGEPDFSPAKKSSALDRL
jgi:hypothetical protein